MWGTEPRWEKNGFPRRFAPRNDRKPLSLRGGRRPTRQSASPVPSVGGASPAPRRTRLPCTKGAVTAYGRDRGIAATHPDVRTLLPVPSVRADAPIAPRCIPSPSVGGGVPLTPAAGLPQRTAPSVPTNLQHRVGAALCGRPLPHPPQAHSPFSILNSQFPIPHKKIRPSVSATEGRIPVFTSDTQTQSRRGRRCRRPGSPSPPAAHRARTPAGPSQTTSGSRSR